MGIYACVRILAESIAGLPLHVYKYRGNGKERVWGASFMLPLSLFMIFFIFSLKIVYICSL